MYANKNKSKDRTRNIARGADSTKLSSTDSRYDAGDYEAVPASVRKIRDQRNKELEEAHAIPAEEIIARQEAEIAELKRQAEANNMTNKYKSVLDDEEEHPTFKNPDSMADFGDYEAVAASAKFDAASHDPNQKVFRAKPQVPTRKVAKPSDLSNGDYEAVAAGARRAVPPDEYEPVTDEAVSAPPAQSAEEPAVYEEPVKSEPAYTEPKPAYTAPEPAYSEPEPAYTAPEPEYTEPEYTAPAPPPAPVSAADYVIQTEPVEPAYTAPEPAYTAPEPSYTAPEPAYTPQTSYTAPEPAYTPQTSYTAPEPAYTPQTSYSAASNDYSTSSLNDTSYNSYDQSYTQSPSGRKIARVTDIAPGDYEAVANTNVDDSVFDFADGSYDFDKFLANAPSLRANPAPAVTPEESEWENLGDDTPSEPDITDEQTRALTEAIAQETLKGQPGTQFEDIIDNVIAKVLERKKAEEAAKAPAEPEPVKQEQPKQEEKPEEVKPEEPAQPEKPKQPEPVKPEEKQPEPAPVQPAPSVKKELTASCIPDDASIDDIPALIVAELDSVEGDVTDGDIKKVIDAALISRLAKGELTLDSVGPARDKVMSEIKEMQEEEARILAELSGEKHEFRIDFIPKDAEIEDIPGIVLEELEKVEGEVPDEDIRKSIDTALIAKITAGDLTLDSFQEARDSIFTELCLMPEAEEAEETEEHPEPEEAEKTEPEPVVEEEPETEPETEPEPEVQEERVAEEEPEPQPKTQNESVTEEEPEPKPEAQNEPVAEEEAEPQPETHEEPVAEEEPEPQPETQNEPVAEEEPELQPEAQNKPVTEEKASPSPKTYQVINTENIEYKIDTPELLPEEEKSEEEDKDEDEFKPIPVPKEPTVLEYDPIADAYKFTESDEETEEDTEEDSDEVSDETESVPLSAAAVIANQNQEEAEAEETEQAVEEPEPEPEVQNEPVAEEEPEPEPEAQDELVAEEEPEPEPEAQDEPVAEEETEPEPEVQNEPVAEEEPEPQPEIQNEPVAEEEPEPQPEVQNEPIADDETGSESEAMDEPVDEDEPELEPEAEPGDEKNDEIPIEASEADNSENVGMQMTFDDIFRNPFINDFEPAELFNDKESDEPEAAEEPETKVSDEHEYTEDIESSEEPESEAEAPEELEHTEEPEPVVPEETVVENETAAETEAEAEDSQEAEKDTLDLSIDDNVEIDDIFINEETVEAEPAAETESDASMEQEHPEEPEEPESSEEPESVVQEETAAEEEVAAEEEPEVSEGTIDAEESKKDNTETLEKYGVNFVDEEDAANDQDNDEYAEAKEKRHNDMQDALLMAMVDEGGKTFGETVKYIMDKEKINQKTLLARMPIDKNELKKIIDDPDYRPDKKTSIAICFALRLTWEDSIRLLYKAGHVLSDAQRYDLTIEYLMRRGVYDQNMINSVLRGSGLDGFGIPQSEI